MTAEAELPFARVVRQRLKERGLGLRELCRAVELDPSFFSKVLAGKRSPPSDEAVLRRIAESLELDAPRLIVAAGRIPREWRRLWAEGELFESIHRMLGSPSVPRSPKTHSLYKDEIASRAATAKQPMTPKARPRWASGRAATATQRAKPAASMGEELL